MSSKKNFTEKAPKREGFEPSYSMQIPKLDNSDNFRIDKIIDEYKNKINSIAKMIIPERKAPPVKSDLSSKNPDILAKIKFNKENRQNLLKINEAVIGKIMNLKPTDPKSHQNMIKRLARGDTKFMTGVPQLKSKDGISLNSPLNRNKLEKYKNEAILELKKIDDSFENKITEKDFAINLINDNCKEKDNMVKTKKSNLHRNNNFNNNNKDGGGFFLTGVGAQHEKKVDFFLGENNKDLDTIENILNNADNNNNNEPHHYNNKRLDTKSNTWSSNKSILHLKKESTRSIFNILKEKANHNKNNLKAPHPNKVLELGFDMENLDKDSDLFSDENRYLSITKKGKNRVKSLQSLGGAWNSQENYKSNNSNNFNNSNNLNKLKESQANFTTGFNYNLENNLEKLKSKETDFFKMSLRTKSLKNLQNQTTAKKEKRFLKSNYLNTMNEFLSSVNTEMDFCKNTFCDIERGIKNYNHIQSVHWDIQPDKLLDKKMIFQDEQFVRKYFIYGTQGGQFISEDKHNDDIIERSDNLAKITPEISYKFKKMIMDRFAEKPLVDFGQFLDRNEYKERMFKENTMKVAKLIDDTDKRRARIEKDLSRIFLKAKK